jgi:hypothetical protein
VAAGTAVAAFALLIAPWPRRRPPSAFRLDEVSLSRHGKHSERSGTGSPATDCGGPHQPQATTGSGAARTAADNAVGDESGDPCASFDHTGKPGERK